MKQIDHDCMCQGRVVKKGPEHVVIGGHKQCTPVR
jgi:hypothetical protein